MAKTATATKTKSATRAANAAPKEKRPPSAYNLFVKEHIKKWKEENPEKPQKEAMAAIAVLWRNAPENPKCGKIPVARAKAGAKSRTEERPESNADSKPKSRTPGVPQSKTAKPKSKPKSKSKVSDDDDDDDDESAGKENE
ncbi:hypothetical protein FISHEDRAFT_62402 [Fistulina hepatica ATCC 64428]|nr:hypothetical protein FISHEDRAFT_62402 [Fistulina hepatica ATCC 64428]